MLSILKCDLCLFQNIKTYTQITKDDIKMLTIYFPKIDGQEWLDGNICNFCKKNLLRRYDFKRKCLNVEQNINNLRTNTETTTNDSNKVNILQVMGLINGNSLDDEILVCRLCLKVIKSHGYFPLFNDYFIRDKKYKGAIKIMKKCFPEINLSSTERPMLCNNCWSEVENSNRFVDMCLQNPKFEMFVINYDNIDSTSSTEESDNSETTDNLSKRKYTTIRKFQQQMLMLNDDTNDYSDDEDCFNPNIKFFIKPEVMEFLELNYNNTSNDNRLSGGGGTVPENGGGDDNPDSSSRGSGGNSNENSAIDELNNPNKKSDKKLPRKTNNNWLKCKYCKKFKTKSKRLYQKHLKTEHNRKLFKCNLCKFQTQFRTNLKNHSLNVHFKKNSTNSRQRVT